MTAQRLPTFGEAPFKTILDGFLLVGHNTDGTFKTGRLVTADGAAGDGVTDDTAAIGVTRDTAGVGGTIVFPPGTYMVHSVFATKANQTWVIQPGATIKSTAVNAQGVVIAVSAAGVRIIGGGIVDGNNANVTTDVAGIFGTTSAATDLTVEGVTIQNCKGSAFFASASRTKFRFNHVTNSPTTSVASIPCVQIAPSGSDIYGVEVVGNTVDLSSLSASTIKGPGIFVGGTPRTSGVPAYDFNVYQARIQLNEVILPNNPSTAGGGQICISFGCLRSQVSGNTTRGGAMGVSADCAMDSIVALNNIYSCNAYAVEIASTSRLSVLGNNIDGGGIMGGGVTGTEGLSAIEMTGVYNAFNATINGNTIYNLVPGSNAIALNTGSQHVVTGNNISEVSGGIVIQSADTLIENNVIVGTSLAGSRGIRFADSTGRSIVAGNFIYGWDKGLEFSPTTVVQDLITVSANLFETNSTNVFDNHSGTGSLGTGIRLVGNQGVDDYQDWKNKVGAFKGGGTPETVVTAGPGSDYRDTTNGELYVKVTGTGNTGWKKITHA